MGARSDAKPVPTFADRAPALPQIALKVQASRAGLI